MEGSHATGTRGQAREAARARAEFAPAERVTERARGSGSGGEGVGTAHALPAGRGRGAGLEDTRGGGLRETRADPVRREAGAVLDGVAAFRARTAQRLPHDVVVAAWHVHAVRTRGVDPGDAVPAGLHADGAQRRAGCGLEGARAGGALGTRALEPAHGGVQPQRLEARVKGAVRDELLPRGGSGAQQAARRGTQA